MQNNKNIFEKGYKVVKRYVKVAYIYSSKEGMTMNRGKLIRKIQMECPLCDKIHEIEERRRIAKTIIKGEEVNYEETYYLCLNSDVDENEFATGKMENNNLLNARNEYRKANSFKNS